LHPAQNGLILIPLKKPFDSLDHFHHLADIGQASPALGVPIGTVAGSGLLFRHDPLHDQGAAVFGEIIFDVLSGIAKAVANQFWHKMNTSSGVAGV
jgi:hypothetical protein